MNPTVLTLTTVAVAVGSNEAKKVVTGKGLAINPIIGGFILGIFILGIATVNAGLATKFCVLLIVTSLLVNGPSLFKVLTIGQAKAMTTKKK
jgi:hypothetical protein